MSVTELRALIASDGDSAWNSAWVSSITPWDKFAQEGNETKSQPALLEVLNATSENSEAYFDWSGLKDKKALVAGCGRGYDVVLLASLGFHTLGIDIAPAGIELATDFALTASPELAPLISFQVADFFSSNDLKDTFTLAYDYTFLCAIPPNLRTSWAKRYSELIEQNGFLITTMFPLDGDREGGPPYSLSVELYDELLSSHFERLLLKKPLLSNKGHEKNEMVAVWRRK